MKSKIPENVVKNLNAYISNNQFEDMIVYMQNNGAEMSKYNETVLLFELISRYISLPEEARSDIRYISCSDLDAIVEPAFLMKDLLHRVEFADPNERENILAFMAAARINVQELMWMIDMFCLDKQLVLERLK